MNAINTWDVSKQIPELRGESSLHNSAIVMPDQGAINLPEIGNLGYDAASSELIHRDQANKVLVDLFFGVANAKLLLIQEPMMIALESAGIYFVSQKPQFVIISSAESHFLDFLLVTNNSKQTISIHNVGDGINNSLRHNAPNFDRKDANGMYFQYQALGGTWPCTLGIYPDPKTIFSVYEKLK